MLDRRASGVRIADQPPDVTVGAFAENSSGHAVQPAPAARGSYMSGARLGRSRGYDGALASAATIRSAGKAPSGSTDWAASFSNSG